MVIIDTSAWIEYFKDGKPDIVNSVDFCLDNESVVIGDLVYCEVMQGIRNIRQQKEVSSLFLSLPKYDMVGFSIAEKAARNYRYLRSKGITVRKTIDVIIATFCLEHDFHLLHMDKDFNALAKYLKLKIFKI